MVRHSKFHRWRHPQRHVDPTEVVECEVQRDGRATVCEQLAMGVRAAGVAAQLHPGRQVAPLYERGTDLVQIRLAVDRLLQKIASLSIMP